MAGMVVAVRPTVIVQGVVQRIEPRAIKTGERAGTVYKTDVTLLTSSGGQTTVEYWERDGQPSPVLPNALDRVAIVVEISPPSGNFGASFGYVRDLGDNDLDLIVSSMPAAAGK
jgi:hypothetical protein